MKSDRPPKNPAAILDLIPFGPMDPMVVSIMAAHIQAIIGVLTAIEPVRSLPEYAFVANRDQFDAAKILKALYAESQGAPFKLGLLQEDLCLPILTYVFGESQLGGRVAVISLHRLADPRPDLFYERAAKIGIHEVGHMVGLEHCRGIDCLMRFSKQIEQLDGLPMHFCTACEYEVSRRIKRLQNNGAKPATPG
jgi:archaemetzincin